jgi:hypothetical protein
MARILIRSASGFQWFEQVGPSTFSEREFEDRVIAHAPSVYPEYFVIPFKRTVESPLGKRRPDLIFIARDYSDWWICEIEMGYHDFASHIEPQVEALTTASYSEAEADYICAQNLEIDRVQTLGLFQVISAKVLVIVNEAKAEWVSPLSRYGAILGVFELFRSENNEELFRVNGEYPSRYIRHISNCVKHPHIPRLLEVISPAELNVLEHERVVLKFNNCITEWVRTDAEGKVYLYPAGRNPLGGDDQYEIYRQGDDTLALRVLRV